MVERSELSLLVWAWVTVMPFLPADSTQAPSFWRGVDVIFRKWRCASSWCALSFAWLGDIRQRTSGIFITTWTKRANGVIKVPLSHRCKTRGRNDWGQLLQKWWPMWIGLHQVNLQRCRMFLDIHNSWFRGVTSKVMVHLYANHLFQVRCKEVCPIIGWNDHASIFVAHKLS